MVYTLKVVCVMSLARELAQAEAQGSRQAQLTRGRMSRTTVSVRTPRLNTPAIGALTRDKRTLRFQPCGAFATELKGRVRRALLSKGEKAVYKPWSVA